MEYNKQLLHRFMTEKVVVHVKTQNEYDKFMELLEKETDIRWMTEKKPTSYNYWEVYNNNTAVNSRCGEFLLLQSVDFYKNDGFEIIEFSDLIKEEKNMKFKVGDKARIRSWENMEKEFGLNLWGDINCPVLFVKGMKKYCGTIQTITAISQCAYYIGNTNYYFDRRAVESVKQETKGEYNRKEIKEIRQQYKAHGVTASVAVDKNDKPCSCLGLPCSDCLLTGRPRGCMEEFKEWCAEPYKAPEEQPKSAKSILDKTEHDYLAAVIAPKRIYKKVKSITKYNADGYSYFIYIKLQNEYLYLPYFDKKDHMYDGMETDKRYTLEELGLKKEDEKKEE